LGATIRIAAVIQSVDAHEDVGCADHFRQRDGIRQEDRVARRHIGHRDLFSVCRRWTEIPIFWNGYVVRERRTAERREIDFDDLMLGHSSAPGNSYGSLD